MREGQPCVVHGVGGLNDTVNDNKNGFVFYGETVEAKVDNFVEKCLSAVDLRENSVSEWNNICRAAQKAEFSWDKSVKEYIKKVYSEK